MIKTLQQALKMDREKFKVPRSVQQAIPIQTIWKDGIFLVGKNKMKDWKAAMRNWARKDRAAKPNNTDGNRFCNFEQREYNYDDLERRLLQGGQ